ncbi:MAG: rhodanese-like domain-containing protein [Actinomycetota bacterium]
MNRRTIDDVLADARLHLRRVEPPQAVEEMQNGALLIDVRSDDQRDAFGSIPGALNIPLSVLEWRVDPESAHRDPAIGALDQRLMLICAHGYSSSLAARRLQEIGFVNATDVMGGFEAWKAAGLPVSTEAE